jgi:hypothetical protein
MKIRNNRIDSRLPSLAKRLQRKSIFLVCKTNKASLGLFKLSFGSNWNEDMRMFISEKINLWLSEYLSKISQDPLNNLEILFL